MQKPRFAYSQIYHIYNRGVEKRNVFMNDSDHLRFIHDLFVFNDVMPTPTTFYRQARTPISQLLEVQPPIIGFAKIKKGGRRPTPRMPRSLLVEILAFCLMPNHFHLLLRQVKENGIVRFMQKLGTGYTMYFNEKYEREGALFQGRFKAVAVNQEAHFVHLPYYIHSNPLDMETPEWRERRLRDHKKAIRFLESYRWSSHLDYLGKKNFPSVTSREFLLEYFGGTEGYKKSLENWLENLNLEPLREITLENPK